jgi:chaperone modulatory protein CbpM
MTRYWMARHTTAPIGWPLDQFAAAAGLHPDLVRRLVVLGLLAADPDSTGGYQIPVTELERVGRIVRLRTGLGLSYTAVGVVLELLDRIDDLETQLRTAQRTQRR